MPHEQIWWEAISAFALAVFNKEYCTTYKIILLIYRALNHSSLFFRLDARRPRTSAVHSRTITIAEKRTQTTQIRIEKTSAPELYIGHPKRRERKGVYLSSRPVLPVALCVLTRPPQTSPQWMAGLICFPRRKQRAATVTSCATSPVYSPLLSAHQSLASHNKR